MHKISNQKQDKVDGLFKRVRNILGFSRVDTNSVFVGGIVEREERRSKLGYRSARTIERQQNTEKDIGNMVEELYSKKNHMGALSKQKDIGLYNQIKGLKRKKAQLQLPLVCSSRQGLSPRCHHNQIKTIEHELVVDNSDYQTYLQSRQFENRQKERLEKEKERKRLVVKKYLVQAIKLRGEKVKHVEEKKPVHLVASGQKYRAQTKEKVFFSGRCSERQNRKDKTRLKCVKYFGRKKKQMGNEYDSQIEFAGKSVRGWVMNSTYQSIQF